LLALIISVSATFGDCTATLTTSKTSVLPNEPFNVTVTSTNVPAILLTVDVCLYANGVEIARQKEIQLIGSNLTFTFVNLNISSFGSVTYKALVVKYFLLLFPFDLTWTNSVNVTADKRNTNISFWMVIPNDLSQTVYFYVDFDRSPDNLHPTGILHCYTNLTSYPDIPTADLQQAPDSTGRYAQQCYIDRIDVGVYANVTAVYAGDSNFKGSQFTVVVIGMNYQGFARRDVAHADQAKTEKRIGKKKRVEKKAKADRRIKAKKNRNNN